MCVCYFCTQALYYSIVSHYYNNICSLKVISFNGAEGKWSL